MTFKPLLAAGAAALAIATSAPALAQDAPPVALTAPEIEYTTWKLDNGLTVYALPDTGTATVFTSMWYDVGSKNDPEGRSGFAHMFEHILSRKTENMPYNLIYSLTADVGGTRNATTNSDRTNYYEQVPAEYLETMLWTHKERMALPVVDEQVFESERGVVKEEFRQRVAAQPYGPFGSLVIPENVYDVLPQRRPTIGSIEQLDSAELGDARAFHQAYYGPDTATLIVAGNFDMANLRSLVDKYFAAIPRRANPVSTDIDVRETIPTAPRVVNATAPNTPLPLVGSMWKAPPAMDPDAAALNMLDSILGSGQSNRLQDALVRSGKAVDKVQIFNRTQEGGVFTTAAVVSPTGDVTGVKAIIDAELAKIRADGVTEAELSEAKNEYFSSYLAGQQTARGRAESLGRGLFLSDGDPKATDKFVQMTAAVTTADIKRVANSWLKPEARIDLNYVNGPDDPSSWANPTPMPTFKTLAPATGAPRVVKEEGEREAIPGPGTVPVVQKVAFSQRTLGNGLDVIAAKTGDVPFVTMTAVFPGGTITEDRRIAGVSALAASLADQGTATMDSRQLAAAFESLGANLSVAPTDEGTLVTVSAPSATIERAAMLMNTVVTGATYPADQVELQRARLLENIKVLRTNPGALAGVVSGPILYGDAPYGIASNETTVAAITPADLVAYREKWWRPDTASVIVSGGMTPEASTALVEKVFGVWRATGAAPTMPAARAGKPSGSRTIVVNLPDAGQAAVVAAVRAPARASDDYFPLSVANAILGGGSSGRLFEDIRTKRSLSYGAYSSQPARVDEGYLTASSQTKNETADEVAAILLSEFDRLSAEAYAEDLVEARRRALVGGNERALETSTGFNGLVAGALLQGRDPGDVLRYREYLDEVTPAQALASAKKYVGSENATLIVVGDASQFLDDLKKIRPDVTVLEAADVDFADPLGTIGE